MKPVYDLADKVVMITGGAGGIGRATARELLSRGARVAILDVGEGTPAVGRQLSPTAALGLVADVTDRDSLDRAVAAVVDRFGRLDVAIANAGILSQASTLRTMTASQIESVLAVNVNGVVNTVTAAMDQVIRHRGQFVLISSVFAFINGLGTIPYAMSKAAVEQLGRGLRVELAGHGVTAMTVYFSLIETDMIKTGVDDDPAAVQLLSTLPRVLLKRLPPEAAASAIAEGLTRRAPRVMAPTRWKSLSALRGVISPPMDSRLVSDRRTQAALANLDRPQPSGASSVPVPTLTSSSSQEAP